MWAKRFNEINIPLESMQTLHSKIKEVHGENLIEVFDYIPPGGSIAELNSYVEIRFEAEPEETARIDELVDQYKAGSS